MALKTLFFLLSICILVFGQTSPTIFVSCPTISNNSTVCVKIGFSYSGTGALSPEGNDLKSGYIFWAESFNQRGGILQSATNTNVFVQLLGYDDRSLSSLANSSYFRLVNQDQVDFLFGPYGTSITKVALNAANTLNKAMIFGSAAGDDLFTMGYQRIFCVATTTSKYTANIFPLLQKAGVTSVAFAISVGTTTFTLDVLNGALANLQNSTIMNYGIFDYPNTTVSGILSVLPAIKALNPDAFFSLQLLADGPTVIQAAQMIQFQPKAFFMTSTPSDPASVQTLGQSIQYFLSPAEWSPSVPYTDAVLGNSNLFLQQYYNRFNVSAPSYTVVEGVASGLVLQNAFQNALSLSQNDVVSALRLTNMSTFFGPIAFDSTGRNILKPELITQVLNGNIKVIAPAIFENANLVYPIPWPGINSSLTQTAASQTIGTTVNSPTSSPSPSPTSAGMTPQVTQHSNNNSSAAVGIAIAVIVVVVVALIIGGLYWAFSMRRKANLAEARHEQPAPHLERSDGNDSDEMIPLDD